MQLVAERAHVIAEGAAALAVAAAVSPRCARAAIGKVVAVVSGGNIDLATFRAADGSGTGPARTRTRSRLGPTTQSETRSCTYIERTGTSRTHCIACPNWPNDLWWTWNPAREVFRTLDYALWRQTAHNPV